MESWINQNIEQPIETVSDKFSIGSLLYLRLRRSTSRVIDVMYLSENSQYAKYVIDLARAANDEELHRLASILEKLMFKQIEEVKENLQATQLAVEYVNSEPTEEDILREQVAHRYIGSLR